MDRRTILTLASAVAVEGVTAWSYASIRHKIFFKDVERPGQSDDGSTHNRCPVAMHVTCYLGDLLERQLILIKLSTNKSVNEAATASHTPVPRNHFGVMQVHNLQETMEKKGRVRS
jgi:hypothetical protein